MYHELLLIAIGFVLLVEGADFLIKGATFIAQRYGVSYFIIGLTIVAFGTSLPELIVNVISALKGNTDIAIGNVVGSNMANILLILGLSALLVPLDVNIYAKKRDIPYALFASVLIFFMALDTLLLGKPFNTISRFDGIVLLACFAAFLLLVLSRSRDEIVDEEVYEGDFGTPKTLLFLVTGLLGLYLGGEVIVENAVTLARQMSVSEILISSTIVAIGTSLPELVTSIIAAYRHNSDIAVGNIVGSNIFNILLVLGVSSTITPISIDPVILVDLALVVVATAVLLVFIYIGIDNIIDWHKGTALFLFYLAYIAMLVIRG